MISPARPRRLRALVGAGVADIEGSGTAQANTYRTGNLNQRWTSTNGAFVNPQSGKCLNAPGTANGTLLQIYDCVAAGQANQQWQLVGAGGSAPR